jgi:hypothetical protein
MNRTESAREKTSPEEGPAAIKGLADSRGLADIEGPAAIAAFATNPVLTGPGTGGLPAGEPK